MAKVPTEITVTRDGVSLPVNDILTGRGFVTGKSGSGKSNTCSVIAEELLSSKLPMMIIDTDGEYFGLKDTFDMMHAGVGEDADVKLRMNEAENIADLALGQNVPVILDVSGFLNEEKSREIMAAVLKELFHKANAERKPFLVLVEEVHEFIPERGGRDELGEILVRIGKRGRKRGIGLCGISQRPAAVDKNFITQCDWMVWHRLTWQNDTEVVRRILGKEKAEGIQNLSTGEAYLMTDWDSQVRRVRFRQKRTLDAGATPGVEDLEHLNDVDELDRPHETDGSNKADGSNDREAVDGITIGNPTGDPEAIDDEVSERLDDEFEDLDSVLADPHRMRSVLVQKERRIVSLEKQVGNLKDQVRRQTVTKAARARQERAKEDTDEQDATESVPSRDPTDPIDPLAEVASLFVFMWAATVGSLRRAVRGMIRRTQRPRNDDVDVLDSDLDDDTRASVVTALLAVVTGLTVIAGIYLLFAA